MKLADLNCDFDYFYLKKIISCGIIDNLYLFVVVAVVV